MPRFQRLVYGIEKILYTADYGQRDSSTIRRSMTMRCGEVVKFTHISESNLQTQVHFHGVGKEAMQRTTK